MGMLMHHTWQKQQEEMKNSPAPAGEPEVEEELPFTEPEEPVEEPETKTVRKTPATRRRKTAK